MDSDLVFVIGIFTNTLFPQLAIFLPCSNISGISSEKTSNEIVLQSQVLELQMKVNALGIANQRLVDKLNQNRDEKRDEPKQK